MIHHIASSQLFVKQSGYTCVDENEVITHTLKFCVFYESFCIHAKAMKSGYARYVHYYAAHAGFIALSLLFMHAKISMCHQYSILYH